MSLKKTPNTFVTFIVWYFLGLISLISSCIRQFCCCFIQVNNLSLNTSNTNSQLPLWTLKQFFSGCNYSFCSYWTFLKPYTVLASNHILNTFLHRTGTVEFVLHLLQWKHYEGISSHPVWTGGTFTTKTCFNINLITWLLF